MIAKNATIIRSIFIANLKSFHTATTAIMPIKNTAQSGTATPKISISAHQR